MAHASHTSTPYAMCREGGLTGLGTVCVHVCVYVCVCVCVCVCII